MARLQKSYDDDIIKHRFTIITLSVHYHRHRMTELSLYRHLTFAQRRKPSDNGLTRRGKNGVQYSPISKYKRNHCRGLIFKGS